MATRELKVNIVGDSKDLERALGRASRASSGLGSALKTLGKVAAIGVGAAFAGMAVVVKQGFDEIQEGQKVMAQTNAALKSTGAAAKVTTKDVTDLATAQSKLTGIDDEAVQAGENMLLTFTKIRNEVGAGNDIFNQATVAIEDMATRMNDGAIPSGEQLSQTAIRVGKALNDPIKGMTALSRVGVQFDASQRKAIEAMVKSGDTMGAQKLILAELTKEFGGSARAAGETLPGQLAKLRNAFDDASAKVAVLFLPALTKLLGFISDRLIPGLGDAAGFVRDFWEGISKKLAQAPNLRAKVRVVFEGVGNLAKQFVDALISAVENLLPQKPLVFNPRLEARGLGTTGGGVDWDRVAADIIAALAAALEQSVALSKALAATVSKSIDQVDWTGLGKRMGPGFATMLAAAIEAVLDPAFWIKNWELTLSLAAVFFRVKIGEFAGKAGVYLGTALFGMLERISPTFAAALGRFIDDAAKVGVQVFRKFGDDMFRLATTIFGRLTKAAVFTVKVLGVMAVISALEDLARIVGRKVQEIIDWFKRLPGRVQSALGDLSGLLTDAGRALIQGLWDGAKEKAQGLLDWLGTLANKVKSVVTFGLAGSPEFFTYYVGKDLMTDMAKGVKEKQDAAAKALQDAIAKARQVVTDARSNFSTAFSSLADTAMQGFDAAVSAWKPKSQKILDEMQLQDQIRAEKEAIVSAQKELNEARATAAQEGTAENIQRVKDAEAALAAAVRAQREGELARDAAQEQAAHDKKMARRRIQFQNELNDLQGHLAKLAEQEAKAREAGDPKKAAALHAQSLALIKKFRSDFREELKGVSGDSKFWGTASGISLADGLAKAMGPVMTALKRLAREIEKYLKLKPKGSWDTEAGPMSDFGHWWDNFAPGLIEGIDYNAIAVAGGKAAKTLWGGVQRGMAEWAGAANIDWFPGLKDVDSGALAEAFGMSTADVTPTTAAIGDVSESVDAASTSVTNFRDLITSLPEIASVAFIALAKSIGTALTKLPEQLAQPEAALLRVASALHLIGSDAYYARNALRDTVDEILILWGKLAARGIPIPGRAAGGLVMAGSPYIVGESGPELFIPSTSGRIVPSSSSGSMTATGGFTLVQNFNGTTVGSSREFEDTVRRALYDVSRRNPGTGL